MKDKSEMAKALYYESIKERELNEKRSKLVDELGEHLSPAKRLYATYEELLKFKQNLLEQSKISRSMGGFAGVLKGGIKQEVYSKNYKFEHDIPFHEELKDLSIYVYHTGTQNIPHGYQLINKARGYNNGFDAFVFKKDNNVVITYRGSEEIKDYLSDIRMGAIGIRYTSQLVDAQALYEKTKESFKDKDVNITLTGHSLGGSLSACIGALNNVPAATFSAHPAGKLFNDFFKKMNLKKDFKIHPENIVNYRHPKDFLSNLGKENDIGVTYEVKSRVLLDGEKYHYHEIEQMDALSTRVPHVSKERSNPNLQPDSNNSASDNKKSDSTQCAGTYPVSGYVRSDGVEVSDYMRTCGAKHLNKNKNKK